MPEAGKRLHRSAELRDGTLFIGSTDSPDRYGDIVRQNWRLDAFKAAGAPALLNHDANQLVGSWDAEIANGRLEARFQPAEPGTSPLADATRKLVDQGILKGASVGFIPHSVTPLDPEDPWGGAELDDNELLEISLTPVPANPDAVAVMRSLNLPEAVTRRLFKTAEDLSMPESTTARRVPDAAPAVHTTEHKYSLSRLARSMMGEDVDAGLEVEFSQELYRRHLQVNPEAKRKGFSVPLAAIFTKATGGTVGANAEPLTGEDLRRDMLATVDDAIRRELLAGRIGVNTLTTNERVLRVPRVTSKLAAEVVALDGALSDAGEPAMDDVSIEPVTMGCMGELLRSAMYAVGADDVVAAQIRNAIVERSDTVVVGPTAGAPTPAGLLDDIGSTASATATLDLASTPYDSAVAIKHELGAYLQQQEQGMWVLDSEWVDGAGGVIKAAGMQVPLITAGLLADRPIVRTYALPETTAPNHQAMFGDFSSAHFAIFGESIDLQLNPYQATSWARGSVSLRAMIDFGFLQTDPKRVLRFETA